MFESRAWTSRGPVRFPVHPLRVILERTDFLVVEKPPGLLSVPGKGEANQDCVISRVRETYPHAAGPLIVHRLDMDTSGLLVVGLTVDAQRSLSGEFEARRVDKAYVALVEGVETPDQGLIDVPIRMDPANRPYQVIDWVDGRPAQTRFQVLAREADRTRIRFEPITGRTHQLRVHAAAAKVLTRIVGQTVPGGLGAPILGDVLYGGGGRTADRLMLHASVLRFRSPAGEWIECSTPPEF